MSLPAFLVHPRARSWIICLALSLAVLAAYGRIGECGFVSLDDSDYVAQQPLVKYGFRTASFVWMFTATQAANFHPLTTSSHLLDCTLFGVNAMPMHWENVLLHLAGTLVLFFLLQKMCGSPWPAALAAAGFGVHPIHVESVAWISERKDVLCGFFYLLGLYAYLGWAGERTRRRAALILLCALLAVLAKPMAVSFPVVLLLLDYWPLRRWPAERAARLLWEKWPLLALEFGFSVLTVIVQHAAGATGFGLKFTLAQRVLNAVVSCARYLGKTVWPVKLAILYPHPGSWPWPVVLSSLALCAAISALAWWQRRARPWILMGWLWFLLTLAPTLGLIQVGIQSMADRYLYLPQIGFLVPAALALAELARRGAAMRAAVIAASLLILGGWTWATQQRVLAWRNGITLFQSLVEVLPNDAVSYLSLAEALEYEHRPVAEQRAAYQRAVDVEPDNTTALTQLALPVAKAEQFDEARRLLAKADALRPHDGEILHARGILALWEHKGPESEALLLQAVEAAPTSVSTCREMAHVRFAQGRYDEARAYLETAIRADWWDVQNHEKLALVLSAQGLLIRARQEAERALWIDPGDEASRKTLADIAADEKAQRKP